MNLDLYRFYWKSMQHIFWTPANRILAMFVSLEKHEN